MRFLDTNIFIRYLTGDDPVQSAACSRLWEQIIQGKEDVTTSETIIAEVCYVLSSLRLYHISHEEIAVRLRPLLSLSSLKLPKKHSFMRALDMYSTHSFLDFEDAMTIAHMEREGIKELVSYDTDFDRIPDITRIEP